MFRAVPKPRNVGVELGENNFFLSKFSNNQPDQETIGVVNSKVTI